MADIDVCFGYCFDYLLIWTGGFGPATHRQMALACSRGESADLCGTARDVGPCPHQRRPGKSAGHAVKIGDVLTVALDGRVRLLKVVAFAERRGDAPSARELYDDMQSPPE
jgi:hypothetical protein